MKKTPSRIVRLRYSLFAASIALGAGIAGVSQAYADVAWVVFDADSGIVLGQNSATRLNAPASLAKMMTVYLTFEALKTGQLRWDDQMPISKNAAGKVRMKLYLKEGETISVRDAVSAMIVVSANDVATVVGEHIAGSEAAFGRLMTQRARTLGMKSTVFANPSGLTDKVSQLTTARDMAVLGMSLKRDFPKEFALFSQRSFTYKGRERNGHNNLMNRFGGVDGIKTGFTNVAGYNLVSSATINGRSLVGAVLGAGSSRERDDRMQKLLVRYSADNAGKAENLLIAQTDTLESTPIPMAVGRMENTDKREISPQATIADLIDDKNIEQGDGGYMVASGVSAWRVQLAATPTLSGAEELQEKYLPVVQGIVPSAKAEITPSVRGRKVYQVRYAGFRDMQAAQNACEQIKRQQIDCLAIRN